MADAISNPGAKQAKRSIGDATSYKSTTGKDQMDGNMANAKETYLRMEQGNILEAKGRDVSNNQADVNGWGGDDAPYKGMALDAPYGQGAGLPGKRGDD